MKLLLFLMSAWYCNALFEGDFCITPDSHLNGTCKNVNSCPYAMDMLKSRRSPSICGFTRNDPLTCCPNETEIPAGKSTEMCELYYDSSTQIHYINNGLKARLTEFPHMAAIGFGPNNSNILWLCGGTLISPYFVLSAAHCSNSREFGPAKWVRLGDLDLKNTTDGANPQDLEIAERFVHPKYKRSSHYHDIALFKLEKRVVYTRHQKPACLHPTYKLPVSVLEVTGWGKVGYLEESSSHLLKASLNVIDKEVCSKRYATVSSRRLATGIQDDYQICAGDSLGKDTCPGDSGGPLHFKVNRTESVLSHFVVVGITSFGKGCGGTDTVGVYTRVSSYISWIEDVVWKTDELSF